MLQTKFVHDNLSPLVQYIPAQACRPQMWCKKCARMKIARAPLWRQQDVGRMGWPRGGAEQAGQDRAQRKHGEQKWHKTGLNRLSLDLRHAKGHPGGDSQSRDLQYPITASGPEYRSPLLPISCLRNKGACRVCSRRKLQGPTCAPAIPACIRHKAVSNMLKDES